ncbi:MAG: hypothetical protein ACOQNV_00785 [Mycoplasmoidaceae bacterium]
MKEPYDVWLLNMQESKIYKTYNQITSEFDVYIMQLSKNNYQFKLVKKLDGSKSPKVTLADVANTLADVIQRLDALDKKLDAIVTANHLIDPTK